MLSWRLMYDAVDLLEVPTLACLTLAAFVPTYMSPAVSRTKVVVQERCWWLLLGE
jgi:hypothetical protein